MTQQKNNKKLLLLVLGCIVAAGLITAGLALYLDKNPQTGKVSTSDLALALLSEDEIGEATSSTGRIRSYPIELNGHMEPEEKGAPYQIFAARQTADRISLGSFVSNSVVLFATIEGAKNFMTVKAANKETVALSDTYGDESLAYFSSASESEPASITLRLFNATVGSKVQVFDLDASVKNKTDAATKLLPTAEKLAKKQEGKITALLNGTKRFSSVTLNASMERLPQTLNNTTFIGMTELTDSELLAITGYFDTDTMEDFVSGGISRLQLMARPEEAVEIMIFEFQNETQAQEYFKTFLSAGVATDPEIGAKEITLPADLADEADGLVHDEVAEVQSAQGRFIVDVAIVSPYGSMNKEAATEDVTDFAQTILADFEK